MHGTKWKKIAECMSGRSETTVKNRFYGVKKRARVAVEEAKKFGVASTDCDVRTPEEGESDEQNAEHDCSLAGNKRKCEEPIIDFDLPPVGRESPL